MKVSKIVILASIISFFLAGCNINSGDNNYEDFEESTQDKEIDEVEKMEEEMNEIEEIEEIEDPIENIIKTMTLEEKVGQLIIAGFEGRTIPAHAIDLINTYKVGGFILFSGNIGNKEQTLELLNNLKLENLNNEIPLFLSIDEEGGKVTRLPESYVKIPEAMKFGNKDDKEISYKLGEILANRVKSLGFNIDFAPILDIYSNPKNIVIGNRAYGNTVEKVVNNGIEVMKGIRSIGIIPAVKHFPGHGDTLLDSHIDLPRVNKSLEELKSLELIPFYKAIEDEAEMIMIAHIIYTELDNHFPASMSEIIIGDLLRKQMGYKGVIVSDDMTMGAIIKNYGLEDGALEFIKSGGDLALICHGDENPILAIEKIIDSVNRGEIREEEIDEKVYRILNLKRSYDLQDKTIENIDIEELNNETKAIIEKISN